MTPSPRIRAGARLCLLLAIVSLAARGADAQTETDAEFCPLWVKHKICTMNQDGGSNNGDDGSRCSAISFCTYDGQWGQCALSASDGGDDWTSVLNKIQVAKGSTCSHADQTPCDDDVDCFWSGETSSCWDTRTAADAYIEQYFTSTPIDSIKAYNAHGDHPNNGHNLHNLFCGTMSLDDAACDGTPGCQYQLSTNDWEANCTAVRDYGLEELTRACGPALDSFSEASASSILGAGYDESKAVDGDAGTWFHSDTGEDHAWFALDLGFSREVHNFSFIGHGTNEGCNCQMLTDTNCDAGCSTGDYGDGGFYVVVSDELPTSSSSGSGWDLFVEATSSGTLCEHVTSWDRTPDGSGVPVTYACPTSTTGRYVYVQTSAKVVIVGETHVGLGSDGADAVARAAGYASFGQLEASASEGLWNPPGADICEAWRNDAMCEFQTDQTACESLASTHGCQFYDDGSGATECYSPDGNHRPGGSPDGMFLYELRQTINHHTDFHSCYGYQSEASCNNDSDCYYRGQIGRRTGPAFCSSIIFTITYAAASTSAHGSTANFTMAVFGANVGEGRDALALAVSYVNETTFADMISGSGSGGGSGSGSGGGFSNVDIPQVCSAQMRPQPDQLRHGTATTERVSSQAAQTDSHDWCDRLNANQGACDARGPVEPARRAR